MSDTGHALRMLADQATIIADLRAQLAEARAARQQAERERDTAEEVAARLDEKLSRALIDNMAAVAALRACRAWVLSDHRDVALVADIDAALRETEGL